MHLKQAYELGVQLALEEAGLVKTAIKTRKVINTAIENLLSPGIMQQVEGKAALKPFLQNTMWDTLVGERSKMLEDLWRYGQRSGKTPKEFIRAHLHTPSLFSKNPGFVHPPTERGIHNWEGTVKNMKPEAARERLQYLQKKRQEGLIVNPNLP